MFLGSFTLFMLAIGLLAPIFVFVVECGLAVVKPAEKKPQPRKNTEANPGNFNSSPQ